MNEEEIRDEARKAANRSQFLSNHIYDHKSYEDGFYEGMMQALRIHDVSQQRELLLAFAKHQRDWGNTKLSKEMHEKEVDHFLKANNCG